MRKSKHKETPGQGRVLARILADELPNVRVSGGGLTVVITGSNADVTNVDGDNDGPPPK